MYEQKEVAECMGADTGRSIISSEKLIWRILGRGTGNYFQRIADVLWVCPNYDEAFEGDKLIHYFVAS